MLRQFSTRRIIAFFLIDWLGTVGMLVFAAYLRVEIGRLPPALIAFLVSLKIQPVSWWNGYSPRDLIPIPVILMVMLIWPFFLTVFSVYDARKNQSMQAELLNVFLAICVSTTTMAGSLYLTYRETPRVLFVIFFLLDTALLLGLRLGLWLYRHTKSGQKTAGLRRVLVIGAGEVGLNAARQLKKYAWADLEVIGFLDDDSEKIGGQLEGIPVIGALDQAARTIRAMQIQDAVVALPMRAHARLVDICTTLQEHEIRVHIIPDLFALSFPNATLDGFGGIPVIGLGQPGLRGIQRILKRAFDVIAVSSGLVLISPMMGLIALLIKLDSRGPVFYRQPRIGENGRLFTMLKFRSMYTDADPAVHKAHVQRLIQQNLRPEQLAQGDQTSLKMVTDARITRVGQLIRKTSLDELPQLFNVLQGNMSLVGPRPPLPYEVELYADWHKRRFEVPPGITGLWQIKGRNLVSFDEMVRMDLEYIQHQSLWLDMKILLQTPRAVLSTRGAG